EKTQKNLKELKINGCFFINRESFANFIARCKSLENLNVDTAQLNYIVIDSIGKNLKKLRIFSIYPLTAYDYHSNPSVVRLSANTITTEQIAFLKNKNRKLTIKIGEQIY
ncbi:hypothetical protein K9L05_01370, partial [Candidatus Babeliales bacterium]|nr:hypothetical protein [Candidatus Babeliales bacterium]